MKHKRNFKSQVIYFTTAGATGLVLQYLVLGLLVQGLGLGAVFASACGFVAGALANYAMNYHLTFKSAKSHWEAMSKFFLVALFGLLLNTCIMFIAVNMLCIYYLFAQILATGVVFVWNFTIHRLWTFNETKYHPFCFVNKFNPSKEL